MMREPQCMSCKHCSMQGMDLLCESFMEKKIWNKEQIVPTFIPIDILSGEFDHRKPYPGDKGVMYEPK